jgi:hypothetical protein
MKRVLSVTLAVALVAGLAGAALAFGPGMGAGWRGAGGMGGGPMGMGGGPGSCPMAASAVTAPGAPAAATPITEDKAKEIATEYAAKYFKGFTVERVLPFAGRLHTAYQVELKGPKGETRILHVNPWGNVRPFRAPATEG